MPPKLPFTLPEMTFLGLGHALSDEKAPTWEPTPEMFTLLLQSLGVLPTESAKSIQKQQQQQPLVTIAVAQELDLSPMHRRHKLRMMEKSPYQSFESEQDPSSQQYILTTSDVEHKYLCKIFTDCELFNHPAVKTPRERQLDAMKRHVQIAIENELGAIEWVRTECSSIKTPEILGYGYHLGYAPEMAEWLDRFGILGFILTSFPRSGVIYQGPGEGSPPLESSAKRHLCDEIAKLVHELRRSPQEQIAGFAFSEMTSNRNSASSTRSRGQDGKIFKPCKIRSRFNLILEAMQERAHDSQGPHAQSSTSSRLAAVADHSSDGTNFAKEEKSQKIACFHMSISSSDLGGEIPTSLSDHDPSVYCSGEAPVGGRVCTLESKLVSPSGCVPWPTQFVHPEAIYSSVAEYEQACLKNVLVALGRLDGALKSEGLFPKALVTLIPRILSLANDGGLFFDYEQETSKDGKKPNVKASHESIFDGIPIVFTIKDLNPSSLIVDSSTGDLLGLINLQYAGFFPAYTEPIRHLFVDTSESTSSAPAFLNSDPSELEVSSDAEDDSMTKRRSFRGLVGSIMRRPSAPHRRQPSTDDAAVTRTTSKGKGKAIANRTRTIVPFSRTGGHPFPFAAVNHFTTNDPLSAAPKSMVFTKNTRRVRSESIHVALEKAKSLSEPKKGSFRSVNWIKRRSMNYVTETKPTVGSNSSTSSQADPHLEEPGDLKNSDLQQKPYKISRHVIVPKALHLCSKSWRYFLCSLREYEVKWVDRQMRVQLSARILQDHCDSYRHYVQDVAPTGEDKYRASIHSSSSDLLSNSCVTPLTSTKARQDVPNRPPSTVSTHSTVIVSSLDTGSASSSKSPLVARTDIVSLSAQKDSDRITHGYSAVLEAFVSMTRTLQNLVIALEVGARALSPEQFLRMIEDKARKEQPSMLQGQNLTKHTPTGDVQQSGFSEEQKRQQQLYRMMTAASAVSPSPSLEPAVSHPKPKHHRVARLIRTIFNPKRPEQICGPVYSYQPPIRTSEDNILYMGPPERDPLPSELPSHLVFVAPPPKTKKLSSTISFSSSSLQLDGLQNSNKSTTYLSTDTSVDDGDTCSYNSDDTDEIRHQIAAPPVVISGGPHYGVPPSMDAIASDIPVYGVRLSARDGVKTLYESERGRLEDEERRFWSEFEGINDRETFQQRQKGGRRHGRVVVLDMEDLEANVRVIERFLDNEVGKNNRDNKDSRR